MKFFKKLFIYYLNKVLFNYKKPKYWTFLYDTANRYVNFYKGEQNADMQTNGEYRILELLFKKFNIQVVFDVGANKGDYAGYALSHGENITVYCFEPDPTVFQKLKHQLSSHRNVFLENKALGESGSTKNMYINKEAPELNSFYDTEEKNYTIASVPVVVDTLDGYCERNHIHHIDLLKIDTEGHELFVLKGGNSLFQKQKIHFVQFEYGNAAIYARTFFRDIFDFFTVNGYHIYKVKPLALEKVVYAPEYEKIMYANFIAVKTGITIE